METKQFFGTDGIRGVANHELTPEFLVRMGRAASHVVCGGKSGKILVGKDPRLSSDMLEDALAAGILSTGVDAFLCGILPTPGVSYLTREEQFQAGIMISASHNPIEDNGIKIFSSSGNKLSDEKEKEIELLLLQEDTLPRPTGNLLGKQREFPHAPLQYFQYLKSHFSGSLTPLRIVLDCAHGATSLIAPNLFRGLGATVSEYAAVPDGEKINVNCGTTNLIFLQETIKKEKSDLGIAFDGDGDRTLLVTGDGAVVNGDAILAALALHWKEQGKLRGPVVTTVMSNFGLEETLRSHGIALVRTPVGDRHVQEEMEKQKANLGGEPSGHILLPDISPTGDGCLAALEVLKVLVESGKTMKDLGKLIREFPQLLVNVRVQHKKLFHEDAEIQKAIAAGEKRIQGRGRIVVRPSGTEPLVRVMAEGPDERELEEVVALVANVISLRLN